jgi:hypothetical protein
MRRTMSAMLLLLLAAACDREGAPTATTSAPLTGEPTDQAATHAAGTEETAPRKKSTAGGPDGLATKMAQIQGSMVEYPNRARDIQAMQRYMAEGKLDMAMFKANKILEQQQNLGKGAPGTLQALLDQVVAERVEYPNRARDIQAMNRYLTEGKFDMAAFKANKILEQQKNVGGGVPAAVKATIARVQTEKVEYPNRARDLQAMNKYITEGKFDMAVFKANKILEQQRNLR